MKCRISSIEVGEWYGITYQTLDEVKARAEEKLNLSGDLEVYVDDECDTLITDDEYLLTLPDNVKLFIRSKEYSLKRKLEDCTDSAVDIHRHSTADDKELEKVLKTLKDNLQRIHLLPIPQLELIRSADSVKVSEYLSIDEDEVDDLQLAINDMILAAEERQTVAEFIKRSTGNTPNSQDEYTSDRPS